MGGLKKCTGAHGEVHEYDAKRRQCPECKKLAEAARVIKVAGQTRTCRGKHGEVHTHDATESTCPVCYEITSKRWRDNNKQRKTDVNRVRQRSQRGWHDNMPDVARDAQGCKCRLCQIELEPHKASSHPGEHADHCHETMVPRALLCRVCNLNVLGSYERYLKPLGAVCPILDEYIETDWIAHWHQLGFDLERP